jgi:hypothetical protein
MPIPASSTAIHGITDAMVAGKRIDDASVLSLLDGAGLARQELLIALEWRGLAKHGASFAGDCASGCRGRRVVLLLLPALLLFVALLARGFLTTLLVLGVVGRSGHEVSGGFGDVGVAVA